MFTIKQDTITGREFPVYLNDTFLFTIREDKIAEIGKEAFLASFENADKVLFHLDNLDRLRFEAEKSFSIPYQLKLKEERELEERISSLDI
jgi:hypothetical protein